MRTEIAASFSVKDKKGYSATNVDNEIKVAKKNKEKEVTYENINKALIILQTDGSRRHRKEAIEFLDRALNEAQAKNNSWVLFIKDELGNLRGEDISPLLYKAQGLAKKIEERKNAEQVKKQEAIKKETEVNKEIRENINWLKSGSPEEKKRAVQALVSVFSQDISTGVKAGLIKKILSLLFANDSSEELKALSESILDQAISLAMLEKEVKIDLAKNLLSEIANTERQEAESRIGLLRKLFVTDALSTIDRGVYGLEFISEQRINAKGMPVTVTVATREGLSKEVENLREIIIKGGAPLAVKNAKECLTVLINNAEVLEETKAQVRVKFANKILEKIGEKGIPFIGDSVKMIIEFTQGVPDKKIADAFLISICKTLVSLDKKEVATTFFVELIKAFSGQTVPQVAWIALCALLKGEEIDKYVATERLIEAINIVRGEKVPREAWETLYLILVERQGFNKEEILAFLAKIDSFKSIDSLSMSKFVDFVSPIITGGKGETRGKAAKISEKLTENLLD